MADILVLGMAAVDFVLSVPEFPTEATKYRAEAAEIVSLSAAQTGDVSITTLTGDLVFRATADNGVYKVRDTAGAVQASGYTRNLTFNAGNTLDIGAGIWLDAENVVRFESGADFQIPTTQAYNAHTLQVFSTQNIIATNRVSVGTDAQDTTIEIGSGGEALSG